VGKVRDSRLSIVGRKEKHLPVLGASGESIHITHENLMRIKKSQSSQLRKARTRLNFFV
jgi:hypothetical protein